MNAGNPYRCDQELAEAVRKFESCRLSPAEFTHRAHLIVALWYLSHFPAEEAAARMREGLRRFIEHHSATGYHETITLFWLKIVRRFLDERVNAQALSDVANELLEKFGDSKLLSEYYSRELIASTEARSVWVEPDLCKL